MRKLAKRTAFAVLKGAGVLGRVAASDWRRSRLVILGYHGVSIDDEHRWDPTLYMSPEAFAGRLEMLDRAGCHVLSLAEGLERMEARDLPPRSVGLTFDDGSHDFYARIWPMLRERGWPATVYLTTYYCQDNRPVFNTAASYLLWKAGRPRSAWIELLNRAERERYTADDKERAIEQLGVEAGVDYCAFLKKRLLHILNPAEVRELHEQGADFQLHTHRHRTPVDRDLFLRELRDNRAAILEMTGAHPSHFCYPCGVHRPEFLPWLREAGVQYATTCEPGLASEVSHSLLLPRFIDHGNLTPLEFQASVSGLGLLLARGYSGAAAA